MHWFDPRHPHRTIGPSGMEVMGMGKVIVTTADENILGDGVLQDGINIIQVDLTNPGKFTERLVSILNNKNDRERIGKNARETANQYFRWERIGAKTLDVYNDILRNKRSNN
jgi:glycosyltransferase involved in cell wall biosynthesis